MDTKVLIPFHTPLNMLICGESNCGKYRHILSSTIKLLYHFIGKTYWLEKLIRARMEIFTPPPARIIVFYKKYQERYGCWESEFPDGAVRCLEGLPRPEMFESGGGESAIPANTLIVLDDFMLDSTDNDFLATLYTVGRHFGLAGVVTVWHQIFPAGKQQRTISLNQHAYVLMKSPRIRSQIPTLGGQLGIRALMKDAYRQATEFAPFSYLVADYSNKIEQNSERFALRTNIFPSEPGPTHCFV